jgi:hypothetical protein
MSDIVFKVMLSSTFDLHEERRVVRDEIIGQDMLPLIMETDSAMPDLGIITSSLAKVDAADAYVVLISNYRYGQVIDDPVRNPNGLSATELEFRRAEERNLPLCIFLMDEEVPVSPRELLKEAVWSDKLRAFRERAKNPSRIVATFKTKDQLGRRVAKTLARLKSLLASSRAIELGVHLSQIPPHTAVPTPPAFYAKPPYAPGHAFQGRVEEFAVLDAWAKSADPLLLVEAIGGMGKSMLTWQWTNHRTSGLGIPWAGRFWYSFYERGADMRNFKISALRYMSGLAAEHSLTRSDAEVNSELVTRLRDGRWLLVLDGLERVLTAYHRFDAAQVRDDEVESGAVHDDRRPTDCIRPADDDLLRLLPAAGPSKILISSRMIPHVLVPFGLLVPGVVHLPLSGLAPNDAERMLRRAGVKGDGARIRRYLNVAFGCHPLLVGFVAGLIRHSSWAKMTFERWEDDSRGGVAVNIADPDIRNRRTNILRLAFEALEPMARELLAKMGVLANAVGIDVLEQLNPARSRPPKEVEKPPPPVNNLNDRTIPAHVRARYLPEELRARLSEIEDPEEIAFVKRQLAERHAFWIDWLQNPEWRFAIQREYKGDRGDLEREIDDLEGQIAKISAKHPNEDPNLYREIAEFQASLERAYKTDLEKYDAYREALTEWHRFVPAWLNDTLADLESRGLLQWDREANTYDLHPVVRGYAVGHLDPGARAEAGQSVATLFATRAEPDYANVASLAELADKLQVVRALNLAGKPSEALDALTDDLHSALFRLELHHDLLPLLRPLFPNGWNSAPSLARDDIRASDYAHLSLAGVDRQSEANAQLHFLIERSLRDGVSPELSRLVRNYSIHLSLSCEERGLALSHAIAAKTGSDYRLLVVDLSWVSFLERTGKIVDARRLLSDLKLRPSWQQRGGQLEGWSLLFEGRLLHREGALSTDYLRAAISRVNTLREHRSERLLWQLLGTWYQANGQHVEAIEAFEKAIQMARSVGLSNSSAEAERALSLARLGLVAEAEAAARSLEDSVDVRLAELWLELNQRDKALAKSLNCYEFAWADGPPYHCHWELEACRAVLRSLGKSEPSLPPFDSKDPELPFESDIRRLLGDSA